MAEPWRDPRALSSALVCPSPVHTTCGVKVACWLLSPYVGSALLTSLVWSAMPLSCVVGVLMLLLLASVPVPSWFARRCSNSQGGDPRTPDVLECNRDPTLEVHCSHPLSGRLCSWTSSAFSGCSCWPRCLSPPGLLEDVQTAREGTQEPLRLSIWALPCERTAPNSQGRGPHYPGFCHFGGRSAWVVALLPSCKQPGVGTPRPQEAYGPALPSEPVLYT